MPKIQGRIIRILDTKTVIINLGRKHGIQMGSIFEILGEPEAVIDPFDDDRVLGTVLVVKGRVVALQVFDEFTIARTKWTQVSTRLLSADDVLAPFVESKTIDEGELLVDPNEVQPWKAQSEIPVQVGDSVRVDVPAPAVEDTSSRDESEGESGSERRLAEGEQTARIEDETAGAVV